MPVPGPALPQETCTIGVPFVVMSLVGVADLINDSRETLQADKCKTRTKFLGTAMGGITDWYDSMSTPHPGDLLMALRRAMISREDPPPLPP